MMHLEEILAMPGCERLREWCAIGPVQRAAFENAARLLWAKTATRERDIARAHVERYQAETRSYRESYYQLLKQVASVKARSPVPPAVFMLQPDCTLEDVATTWAEPSSIAPNPPTR